MKIKQSGNHLDQMMRQSRAHHVQLSEMADRKANMLLTIASVVITLSVPRLVEPQFMLPAVLLIGFCLLTIVLTTYAVMPRYSKHLRQHNSPDVHDPGFNLLFFGDFVQLSSEEFESAMEKVMNDPSAVYEAMVRELYTLGSFLARKKYRFIRWAYLSFISGLFISGIALALILSLT
ncbi:MAG: hypothetical protein GXO91_00690 [FCB group bacterium]|nr:hypothetical protein [FCB group bacterium]